MNRVFFLASHACAGASGGGHGVEYRLYLADRKYDLFKRTVIYVFGDRVIEGKEKIDDIIEQKDVKKQSALRVGIKRFIPSKLRIAKMEKRFNDLKNYLFALDCKYHFDSEDIFICHDFRIAYAFVNAFTNNNCALVYHMQGSIYNEWSSETGIQSVKMRSYYNEILSDVASKVKYFCFPSKGTEESLIGSEPLLTSVIEATSRRYLYNGVECPSVNDNELPRWISDIKRQNVYKFVTVATLNAAKAVERIPEFLYNLNKEGIPFLWILVGNGIKADEVEKQILKFQLNNQVIWKKNGILHEELMKLLSVTDFYILFHKYSIFDLSTLEAMHYGNIPILTPVGGNKEVIINGNGLFVDDFSNVKPFIEMLKDSDMESLKRRNSDIQNMNFNDEAFLRRYVDLCDLF